MAGKYGVLTASQDFLEFFSTLDAVRQQSAENTADAWIDRMFEGYDRTTWSGASSTTPPEVRDAWLRWASADYITRDFLATNPAASDDQLAGPKFLRDDAMAIVQRAQTVGYLVGLDGARLGPVDDRGAGDFSVEVTR